MKQFFIILAAILTAAIIIGFVGWVMVDQQNYERQSREDREWLEDDSRQVEAGQSPDIERLARQQEQEDK